jgi:hypothetical protein
MDDPLSTMFSLAERTYLRMQAGDLLTRCLDENSSEPIRQMVETLVLAGPQSLSALREVLAETNERKSQALEDLHQIYSNFEASLRTYGVRLVGVSNILSVARLTPARFAIMLRNQQVTDAHVQTACVLLLKDTRDLIRDLAKHLKLLQEIEKYLEDWLWGIAYQLAHQEGASTGAIPPASGHRL